MSKLTTCKICGAEIAKNAKSCPQCGAKNKKPIFTRWWFWLLIVLVIFLLLPGGSDDTAGGVTVQNDDVTIVESVVYDQDGVKITVTGMETSFNGVDINMLVENNTAKNLAVSCDDFVVNGITMYGYMYIDAAAGMKSNDSIFLSAEDLSQAGVEKISTVDSYAAHLVNTDTYMTEKEISFNLVTTAYDYVQVLDDSGDVLYDQNGLTVIAKTISEEYYGGCAVVLVKNDTGKDVVVQADNLSVNGFTITPLCSADIRSGSARFVEIDVTETDLEENGIEELETFTFTLSAINPTTFSTYFDTPILEMTTAK